MEAHPLRKGLALILVVGVLGVLAVLGSAFVVLSRMERRAAAQRILSTQALLLSRSGIEDALARLDRGQDPDEDASRYGGEDWDMSSRWGTFGWPLSALEAAHEVHRRGTPDRESCPARHAMRPSWFLRLSATGPNPMPSTFSVDGRLRGITGRLAAGTWSLRVLPETGFHANGGDPAADPALGYNAVLRRILGTLAKAVDEEQSGGINGSPVSEADGFNLVDLRPRTSRGWESWEQVKALAFGGSQAKLDALKPYLALSAWVDTSVVAPNATVQPEGKAYESWGAIRMDRSVGSDGTRAPDLERINGKVVGRAPVDLNWARKRMPALLALVSGLKAQYLDDNFGSAREWAWGDMAGHLYSVEIVNSWSPADDAHFVAGSVAFMCTQISSWGQWEAFVETIPFNMLPLTNAIRKEMLKVMANPNTALNKLNPGPSRLRSVDKSDFLVRSTEMTLLKVCPYQIESAGRVVRNGKLLASRSLQADRPRPGVERLSTQADFACERLGMPEGHGDEADARLPGFLVAGIPAYLSESQGTGRTWGHRLDVRSLAGYGGSWVDGGSAGVGLQTYPEPCFHDGTTILSMRPAHYDGCLQLATMESIPEDFYAVAAATRNQRMLAAYDDGMELDVADGSPACQADVNLPSKPETGNGIYHALKPCLLLPDGVYSETGRAPGYLGLGNLPPTHGVASFWAKSRGYARRTPYVTATNDSDGGGSGLSTNQFFMITAGALHFEISHNSLDQDQEHEFGTGTFASPHVWSLVTAFWDFLSPSAADAGDFYLDAGGPGQAWLSNAYTGTTMPAIAQDLTVPDRLGAHLLALGTRAVRDNYFNQEFAQGADATFDELVVYDFGGAAPGVPAPADALAAPATLAQARWKEGRYYKGSFYDPPGLLYPSPGSAPSWVSGPVPVPAGSVLRRIGWTWTRPAALPTDYPEVELLKASADGWLRDEALSRSTLAPGWHRDRWTWDPSAPVDGPFRLRVVFRRDTPVDDDTPILESPVLDDLTLFYEPKGGPRLLGFRSAE